jgi:GT2 family glycosyltransferase
MHKTTVLAMIPNWNGSRDTLDLLDSLAQQSFASGIVDAVVVDNASSPSEIELLEQGLKQDRSPLTVYVVRAETNLGVPAAYNRAIQAADRDYDYYLRLDNDVVLFPHTVERLCQALDERRGAGIRLVGGEIRFFDQPGVRNCGAVTVDHVRGRTRVSFPERDTVCDGVLGCTMMLDAEVVKAFRPDVFLSWLFVTTDETEISMRARRRGWLTLYLPEPIALHKGGRSTSKVREAATLLSQRNWTFLNVVYAPSAVARVAIVARTAMVATLFVLAGRRQEATSMIRGLRAGLLGP